MSSNKPRHIRVFLSSPGDVSDERGLALSVLDKLPYDPFLRGKISLEVVAWDKPGADTPLLATMTPQEAINQGLPLPAQCDIVVVLFWSRMGTPLPKEYTKPDGSRYLSGTEWEYYNAFEAAKDTGSPLLVVYRRMDKVLLDPTGSDFMAKYEQFQRVQSFFKTFENPDGSIRGGYNQYDTPEQFRESFETHVRSLVQRCLERSEPEIPAPKVQAEQVKTIDDVLWEGSPFPGLNAFTEAEAPIFFGRGRETDKLVQMLGQSRFVAVVGASGSGKSSLVGAGLIPRLRSNALEGSREWHIVRCVPGEKPFLNLAQALIDGIPALAGNPIRYMERSLKLADILAKAPNNLGKVMSNALKTSSDWSEVLLFVDQFEELLTLTAENQRQAYTQMLTHPSSKVRVVVTMRADFYHRMLRYLEEPLRGDGTFTLDRPSAIALYEMISRPAERAGLSLEDGLAEQIVNDTGDEPGALALMAYALDELYKLDDDKQLTHAEYEELGGVQKAIGTRAEHIFNELEGDEASKEETLFSIFRELIEVDEKGTATRRRIAYEPAKENEAVREMISAFANARLLTTNQSSEGATLEVAHEALLREWGRLANWIELTQDDHRTISRMRREAQTWKEQGRPEHLRRNAETLKEFEAACERLGVAVNDGILSDFTEPEQERLYRELQVIETSHERRRDIGDRLAVIGDTRRGIGVKDGLPEIEWLPIKEGGKITIEYGGSRLGDEGDKKRASFEVKPFYIAKYLVTYAQYQAFAESDYDNPNWWQGFPKKYQQQELLGARSKMVNAPRDDISWYQSIAFSRWLDAKYREKGLFEQILGGLNPAEWQIRLPTEWEWQWAAQNGKEERQYPWGKWQEGYANTNEAGLSRSTSVGMYPHGAANCGAMDMSGNLYEWCANNHGNPEIIDAKDTSNKVLRGGAFHDDQVIASYLFRYYNRPSLDFNYHGVRLILSSPIHL